MPSKMSGHLLPWRVVGYGSCVNHLDELNLYVKVQATYAKEEDKPSFEACNDGKESDVDGCTHERGPLLTVVLALA